MNIITAINFCTNDFRFLRACIEGVRPFSMRILISTCDHFFDGTQENYALLEHAYRSFPDCLFIEYAFAQDSYRLFTPHYRGHPNWRHEWANTGRWIAYHFLPQESDYILFLDVDEIIDGERLKEWHKKIDISAYSALSFSAYWYFREARFQATRWDDISILIKTDALTTDHLWHSDERTGILIGVSGKKLHHLKGLDSLPLVHHYSWVRTQEELNRKFTTWPHHWERPWQDLLKKEFTTPFQGTDFIRGYSYTTVLPYFDPLSVSIPHVSPISLEEHLCHLRIFSNVIRVDSKHMQRKEILCSL